jgi:hypothetical protein
LDIEKQNIDVRVAKPVERVHGICAGSGNQHASSRFKQSNQPIDRELLVVDDKGP